MSNTFNGYTQLSRAWYGDSALKNDNCLDRFTVGLYLEEGGCEYEFSILIDDDVKDSARVCIYDDSFRAFVDMHEFFELLSINSSFPSSENIKQILDSLGFRDITRTEMPE